MIVDFHSHILPAFDDGAQNVEKSLDMLRISREMGVECVVSTSHCYPDSSTSVRSFINKRKESYETLMKAAEGENIPDIRLGAEVHLSTDLSRIRNIRELCIEGTNYMLVEMPNSPWNERAVECIYKLTLMGITPIIAHAERNMNQRNTWLESLYDFNILIQINTTSFYDHRFKGFIDKMMRSAMIHIVGTDMHNTDSRPPNMKKALKSIQKRYGEECCDYLMENAEAVLNNVKLSYRNFKPFKKRGLL